MVGKSFDDYFLEDVGQCQDECQDAQDGGTGDLGVAEVEDLSVTPMDVGTRFHLVDVVTRAGA